MKRFMLLILISLFALSLAVPTLAREQTSPVAQQSVATKHVFGVHGLTCPFCVVSIKKTFEKMRGVKSVDVSLKNATATVYTEKGVCFSPSELKKVFENLGFVYHGTVAAPKECEK